MYYIYILHSPSADRFYIGFTSVLEGRVDAHNHPRNKGWTKRYQPWELVYSEQFESKKEAMAREKQIKSFKNKNYIRKITENP